MRKKINLEINATFLQNIKNIKERIKYCCTNLALPYYFYWIGSSNNSYSIANKKPLRMHFIFHFIYTYKCTVHRITFFYKEQATAHHLLTLQSIYDTKHTIQYCEFLHCYSLPTYIFFQLLLHKKNT